MKGDYNRYLAEFLLDDEYNKVVDAANQAYKEANYKSEALDHTNPIKLGLLLNLSVFYYEIMQKTEKDGFIKYIFVYLKKKIKKKKYRISC